MRLPTTAGFATTIHSRDGSQRFIAETRVWRSWKCRGLGGGGAEVEKDNEERERDKFTGNLNSLRHSFQSRKCNCGWGDPNGLGTSLENVTIDV